jgi:hypothetical protein
MSSPYRDQSVYELDLKEARDEAFMLRTENEILLSQQTKIHRRDWFIAIGGYSFIIGFVLLLVIILPITLDNCDVSKRIRSDRNQVRRARSDAAANLKAAEKLNAETKAMFNQRCKILEDVDQLLKLRREE